LKHTLLITQRCNLACRYCYIDKKDTVISLEMAKKIICHIFDHTPAGEILDFGFFGGEPLLEFDLLKRITHMITEHPSYDQRRVVLRLVSNGTLFSDEIASFLEEYSVGLGISCDGPEFIQNKNRLFINGKGTSKIVEKNIKHALQWFPILPVNAVFSAETIQHLPEVIDYFYAIGVKNIHLNPDITSAWEIKGIQYMEDIYTKIAQKYIEFYLAEDPVYISLIDSKIAVILRGGYRPEEKCRMGMAEFAYAPSGNIYPCERLVGGDDGASHCIGNIKDKGIMPLPCNAPDGKSTNIECQNCSVQEYCMNWCGCTNFFATGEYTQVNHVICAAEKAAIHAALEVIKQTRENNIHFSDHLAGTPLMSIIGELIN